MDVTNRPRERVFSILNDNNCPSFVIRQRPSASPRQAKLERPSLLRAQKFTRASSISSVDSPPLLRFDSTSSKSSNSSMDSPSPATPAYAYNDATLLPYDNLLRQDLAAFIPSPTTITPFMEQQLLINSGLPDIYPVKTMHGLTTPQYHLAPAPPQPDIIQLPTPASSLNSASTSNSNSNNSSKTSPPGGAPAPKKNKYPCPFAQSHNCQATFTTSGHAARHGKKHTGEKGVHCPVCNKAFTRKDNMKQHERTHKGSLSGASDDSNARRSKAAITKDAVKAKTKKLEQSISSDQIRANPSLITSPLSEVTTLPSRSTDTPINIDETGFYSDVSNPMLLPAPPMPESLTTSSLYPPLGDDTMLGDASGLLHTSLDKLPDLNSSLPMPPLIRGFSDLDTLAQAAESFDPYYTTNI